jgi:transcriptional regulator GlxA family with amidase domain
VTAAGVSAGIDMALVLVERIAGPEVAQAIQLGIEYDPDPPHDAGSPQKAPAAIVELTGLALSNEDERVAALHAMEEGTAG